MHALYPNLWRDGTERKIGGSDVLCLTEGEIVSKGGGKVAERVEASEEK